MQQRFHTSSDPAKVAFGGGSFAGVAALYAAMHYPHVFGVVLAESPSLWIAEGRFLQVRDRGLAAGSGGRGASGEGGRPGDRGGSTVLGLGLELWVVAIGVARISGT